VPTPPGQAGLHTHTIHFKPEPSVLIPSVQIRIQILHFRLNINPDLDPDPDPTPDKDVSIFYMEIRREIFQKFQKKKSEIKAPVPGLRIGTF
jgi:hypothetical protein